uniref:Uncharacterized protein n=1 Tax=Rhabditophanes sp. KR3021 TaxID=114890 RepID=A0AC35U089_9BILA
MLLASSVLKSFLHSNSSDECSDAKNLGKHPHITVPSQSFEFKNDENICSHINLYSNDDAGSDEECNFDDHLSVYHEEPIQTNIYFDDDVWNCQEEVPSMRSSTVSSKRSHIFKWNPKSLASKPSSAQSTISLRSTLSSTCTTKRAKRRRRSVKIPNLDNLPTSDKDTLVSLYDKEIKLRVSLLDDSFVIKDQYIDDTYYDEGCFYHLEFHIF